MANGYYFLKSAAFVCLNFYLRSVDGHTSYLHDDLVFVEIKMNVYMYRVHIAEWTIT